MAVWQVLRETSSSVALKVSGEYCSPLRLGRASGELFGSPMWRAMSRITCVTFMPNTMRRHAGAVALYRCTMARARPARPPRCGR